MRLIDADAFIKENQEIIDCEIDHPKYQDTLRELISQAPTVERPHGEWIINPNGLSIGKGIHYAVVCSLCNWSTLFADNFCPNCGANMREGESEVQT